ncbi:MAG: hypothetical protein ACLPT6_12850 [Desulfobaccales bacterium]
MSPEEERFNELLSQLKSTLFYPPRAITEPPADHLTDLEIAIWIMESNDIFHEGRLKGSKKAASGRPQYNSYPIKNLETLVREAAGELFMWLQYKEHKYTDRESCTARVAGLFDRLLQSYDEMAKEVSFMRIMEETTIKKTSISNTRKVIEGWKTRVLKNIKPRVGEATIKIDLAKLFIIQVPDAKSSRIAECVRVLLSPSPFNVKVNIETFRKEVKKLKEDIEATGD